LSCINTRDIFYLRGRQKFAMLTFPLCAATAYERPGDGLRIQEKRAFVKEIRGQFGKQCDAEGG